MANYFRGWIKNLDTGKVKKFQYTPTELEYDREVQYSDIVAPGQAYPDTQYVRGKIREFDVEVFIYDNPCKGEVIDFMKFIGAFLTPEYNWNGYKKPPEMIFSMGYFIRRCVLKKLNIKIERFDPEGQPIQARYTLTLRQVGI